MFRYSVAMYAAVFPLWDMHEHGFAGDAHFVQLVTMWILRVFFVFAMSTEDYIRVLLDEIPVIRIL